MPKNFILEELYINYLIYSKIIYLDFMVIWIIGRSSSGKTFIGKKLFKVLSKKRKCFLVDGDNVRAYLNDDLGYTLKDRKENSLRIQNFVNI